MLTAVNKIEVLCLTGALYKTQMEHTIVAAATLTLISCQSRSCGTSKNS